MKPLFFALFLALSGMLGGITLIQAQDVFLSLVWKEGQFGYIDLEGREVIPEIYDDIMGFSEGLVAVNVGATAHEPKTGGLWGFCNYDGHVVIKMQYEAVRSFHEGIAGVKQRGRWGFINPQGEWIVPPTFEQVGDFSDGLAAICLDKKWGYVNSLGSTIIPPQYDFVYPFDSQGVARVFVGYLYPAKDKVKMDGYMGLINRQGKEILSPCYKNIGEFSEGLAVFSQQDSVGYINAKGQVVIPAVFVKASAFSEGVARVTMEDRMIRPFETPEAQSLYDSLMAQMTAMTIAAGNDKQKLERLFNSPLSQKLSALQRGRSETVSRVGFINQRGEPVISLKYDWAGDFERGLAAVRLGRYPRQALRPKEPIQADAGFWPTDDELIPKGGALHKPREGYGYVNAFGEEVIPPIYPRIERYSEDVFVVPERHLVKAIDRSHREVIPARYQYLQYCGDGLFLFADIDRKGIVHLDNTSEEVILDGDLDEITYLGKGLFSVMDPEGELGIIDHTGKWIIPPIYEKVFSFEQVNPE